MRRIILKSFIFMLLILTFIPLYENINAEITEKRDINIENFNRQDNKLRFIETEYVYILFYMGRIDNSYKDEHVISFDAVNLWRISYLRASDGSFWDFSISHYKDAYHNLNDYKFFGILNNHLIIGLFFKLV